LYFGTVMIFSSSTGVLLLILVVNQ
jgi:hypothetical protein